MKTLLCSFIFLTANILFAQQISEPSFNAFNGVLSSGNNIVIASVGDLVTDELGNDQITLGGGVETLSVVILDVDEDSGIEFQVYPNPSSNKISVFCKNIFQTVSLSIVDTRGSIIYKQILSNEINEINLTDYKSGIYIIKIFAKEKDTITTFKLIKE